VPASEELCWLSRRDEVTRIPPSVVSAEEASDVDGGVDERLSTPGTGNGRNDSVSGSVPPFFSGLLSDIEKLVPADGSSS